jgi:hypothetical protein
MERDEELVDIVISYLRSHGYPEESIIQEWKISDRYRVDLAILDNKSKTPIALFEFKRQRDQRTENMAIEQLKNYSNALGDNTIPCYIVFGIETEPSFELYYLTKEDGRDFLKQIIQIPSFSNFKNNYISKNIAKATKATKSTFNWFKAICWILALIIALLLYMDFQGCIKLTAERLGIIAIIVGLIIVPFARKLSILGLEFERLQDEK